ncbi:uncharacterized protein LOC143209170 isoform X2 [Lasioglossum baleicum]|uniref:uncharacterized protein LOC143209170 isoform X2 n=1 Tax=Lasioglossum baleicum TaxID=434251 RepID=UPI003FCC44A6
MCTCSNSTQCTEDYHTAQSEIDPSSAFGSSWRTPPNETPPKSLSGICAADCSAPSTPKSRIGISPSTPTAPPRMPRDPRLRSGLAVARRIDFAASSTAEWEDSVDELGLYGMQPLASSSFRCPETPDRPPPSAAGGTYSLKRHRPTPFPQSSRLPPRMTKMTPCGKCLRM